MFLNPWLLTDFYKLTHILQYRPELRELTSYLTPRGSRLKGVDKVVFFGLSAYVHSYVVKNFNDNFFNCPWDEIAVDIADVLKNGLGYTGDMITKTLINLHALHDLHYLPVEINAVAEGTLVPMGVPCLEIKSTNPQFFWVGQALEASLSAAIWHPMVSATIAREYRKIAREAFAKTVENGIDERVAMCDFSMRGQESNESAVNASVAWLTSMWNSSTVAARKHIQNVYGKCTGNVRGLTSTEHSVMTSHACLDGGDEIPTFKYLFDLYKNVSFAAVCDSYDFWNVLTNILPNNFMEEINERGKRGVFIGVRHDSAEPVDALCGIPVVEESKYVHYISKCVPHNLPNGLKKKYLVINPKGNDYIATWDDIYGKWETEHRPRTYEEMGMVETMYEIFGGTINSKGYKVLNPGIKAVYGDSITITRAKQIYERLAAKDFAANNVSLGVGSFSFQALENEDGSLSPFTRDTFSIACKTTHSKYVDEYGTVRERWVYKSPKNFSQKKSQRGLCRIFFDKNGNLTYEDELYEKNLVGKNSALITYFKNGEEFKQNFEEIRNTVTENL
ncbi:MAG: DUF5598 domain-containing protein [Methanobrevibacter sp.]|nr:DUF5598 domain-containing protein [Methanobrevibacter sp.]